MYIYYTYLYNARVACVCNFLKCVKRRSLFACAMTTTTVDCGGDTDDDRVRSEGKPPHSSSSLSSHLLPSEPASHPSRHAIESLACIRCSQPSMAFQYCAREVLLLHITIHIRVYTTAQYCAYQQGTAPLDDASRKDIPHTQLCKFLRSPQHRFAPTVLLTILFRTLFFFL